MIVSQKAADDRVMKGNRQITSMFNTTPLAALEIPLLHVRPYRPFDLDGMVRLAVISKSAQTCGPLDQKPVLRIW